MSKIKVAIIGCGNIANSAHLPAYQAASDLCEVKYFCDLIEERATALRDKYGRDRKSTRLNSSHSGESRMPSSA